MPTTTNKVKFGLKNVHYAPITSIADDGTVTYGTVGEIKGAVNLSMDPNGGVDIFSLITERIISRTTQTDSMALSRSH